MRVFQVLETAWKQRRHRKAVTVLRNFGYCIFDLGEHFDDHNN